MNQLKQQAAQQLQTLNNPPPSSLSSTKGDSKQYASTFQPPQPAWESKVDELDQSAATATAPSTSSQQSMVGEDDVQWTEGYEKLKAKPLDGSDESAEEEDAWNLPEDYSQLNAEVLSSLPAHIRKSIVEEARRKERARARAHYIPVAGNPLLYSQTQLANFLQTTKLNKRFEEAQKLIDGNTEGRTIAAEGGKRYKLIQSNVINSLSQSDIRSEQAEKPSSGVNHDESSDDEFTSRDWAYSAKHPSSKERGKQSTKHRKVIVDEESDDGDDARGDDGVGGGFFVDDNDVNTTPMPSAPPGNSAEHGAVTNQTTALKNAPTSSSCILEEPVIHCANFYSGLHASDSEEEGDDIEWEAEQCVSVDAEDAPREEIWNVAAVSTLDGVVEGNGVPHIEVVIQDTVSDSEEGKECSVDNQEGEIDLTADALIPKVSTSADLNSTLAVNLETAALDRAVETASKLADWAGRAVRRVLKDHVKKTISNVEAVSNQEVSEVEKSEPQSVSQSQQGVIFAYDDEQSQTWEPVEPNADSHPLSEFAGNSQAVNLLPDMNDYEMDNPEETYRRLVTSTRDSERLTEEMKEEVIQLLKAFDLPYIIAPFEAEAQCAVLEQLGLVNGVVTEDSDSFLFGAQAVFKNIFNDKKYVEVYLAEDVKRELGLSREDLIALAYFLGSDYTEGVHGIGIVNAMEIIQAFKANDGGALTGLNRFKDWLQGYDFAQEILEDLDKRQQKRKVKGKLPRRVDADDDSSTAGSDEAELKERHIATDENADDAIGYRTATDKRLVEHHLRVFVCLLTVTAVVATCIGGVQCKAS